jgi:predicted transposase/invertase (TIGR01784 family)
MTFEMLMEERFEAGMEKGIEKGREQGIEQGAYNTKLETAKNALSMNLPPEDISRLTGLPLETVLELKDRL